MNKDLKQAQEETLTETAVTKVVQGEVADVSLRTVAKVKARLRAYELIFDNYQGFITMVASELADGKLKGNTYKEMSVARLVAQWIVDTETFLTDNEDMLYGVERETRSRFVEDALKEFPTDIKELLMGKLKEKKHELLEWFAKELQLAQKLVSERRKENETNRE